MPRPRVFLDSSVIIAVLLSSSGGSSRILTDAEGRFAFKINSYIFDEVRGILETKFARQPELATNLLILLGLSNVEIVSDASRREVRSTAQFISRNDAPVLAGALTASDYLLTLDNEFFTEKVVEMATKHKLTILKPGDFIARFFPG